MMSEPGVFKDNFSAVAQGYQRFRPTYPEALFDWLAAIAPRRETAWDCACGNGQASIGLARHFGRVFATDASAQQIENAQPFPNIAYSVAPGENSGLADGSIDLVLVAQAVHWFDFDAFFAEVGRVGRDGGILALAAYELHRVSPVIDEIIDALYEPVLGDYWSAERRHIKAGYRSIPFPFEDIATPDIFMSADWRAEDVIGYMATWSSVSRYRERNGTTPWKNSPIRFARPGATAGGPSAGR